MAKKKKGPLYTDDPECVYIVIDDPWPGNLSGAARHAEYFRSIAGWVCCMLGKGPVLHKQDWDVCECIYWVNTRREVIVKLPQGTDVSHILGAHPWSAFVRHCGPEDRDRVSCVFLYNYPQRGHPEFHNWNERLPEGGPPRGECAINLPYPPPGWSSHHDKNCKDLVLPLPRPHPQPPPPPNLFEPYEPPAHLDAALTASATAGPPKTEEHEKEPTQEGPEQVSAQEEPEQATAMVGPELPLFVLTKNDPYEEEDAAMQFIKAEPLDDFPLVKQEVSDIRIKQETFEVRVKQEEPPEGHEPSAAFLAVFERIQEQQALLNLPQSTVPPPDTNATDNRETVEPVAPRNETPGPRIKPEPQEAAIPPLPLDNTRDPRRYLPASSSCPSGPGPSNSGQGSHFDYLRETRNHLTDSPRIRVKPEPEDHTIPPDFGLISQPVTASHRSTASDPRRVKPPLLSKRVKEEEEDGVFVKRIKREY